MKKKILLIQPPFYRLFKSTYSLDRYPLSLGYIGGTIKRDTSWDVTAWNTDFSKKSERVHLSYFGGIGHEHYLESLTDATLEIWSDIRTYLEKHRPSVVGITSNSQNFRSVTMIAKIAKEVDRRTIVIVGGPHPSIVGKDTLNCPDIDIAVKGEGERTIIELLDAFDNDRDIGAIKGIVYRKDGQAVENHPRELIEDIDSLCFPHEYAPDILKDFGDYPLGSFQNIFAVRGCPHNCSFCGSRWIWTRKPRFRSPGNVVRQVQSLMKMGLRRVVFEDDTFGINSQYIRSLCTALGEHCPGIKWRCEIHVNLVNNENISLMKKAGCNEIFLGVESGNNQILKAMKKGITIEQAISAADIIRSHHIQFSTFIMAGYVGETKETLNDTLNALKRMRPDFIIFSIFMPYLNTEVYELCKGKGLIDESYDVSLHNHQSLVNNFSDITPKETYNTLIHNMAKNIDRYNYLSWIKLTFSWNSLRKVKKFGIVKALKKGWNIIRGK